MRWTRSNFKTRRREGWFQRKGYVYGSFGISKEAGSWHTYHLPSGLWFIYGTWVTIRQAKRFAEGLLAEATWEDEPLNEAAFNAVCHRVADKMQISRRYLKPVA